MKLFQNYISLNTLLLAAARKGSSVLAWLFEQGVQRFTVVETKKDQLFRTSAATPLSIVYSIVNLIDSYNSDYAYLTQKMSLIPITVPIARGR